MDCCKVEGSKLWSLGTGETRSLDDSEEESSNWSMVWEKGVGTGRTLAGFDLF